MLLFPVCLLGRNLNVHTNPEKHRQLTYNWHLNPSLKELNDRRELWYKQRKTTQAMYI